MSCSVSHRRFWKTVSRPSARVGQRLGVGRAGGQRLVDEHVQPGVQRGEHVRHVLAGRARDDDEVELVGVREQPVDVGHHGGAGPVLPRPAPPGCA